MNSEQPINREGRERTEEPREDILAEPVEEERSEPEGAFLLTEPERQRRLARLRRVKGIGGFALAAVLGIYLWHELDEPNDKIFVSAEAEKAGREAFNKAVNEVMEESRKIDLEKIARLARYQKPKSGEFREFDDTDKLSEREKIAIESVKATALPFGSVEVRRGEDSSDSMGKTPKGKVAFEIKDGKVIEWMGIKLDNPVPVGIENAGDEVIKQVLQELGFTAEVVNRNSKDCIGVRLQGDHFIVINPEREVIYADYASFNPAIALTDTRLRSILQRIFKTFTEGLAKKKKDPQTKLGWAPLPRDIANLRDSLVGTPPHLFSAREQVRAFVYPESVEFIPENKILDYGKWYKIKGHAVEDKVVKIYCKYPDKSAYEVAYREDFYETLDAMAHGGLFRFGPKGQILATGDDRHIPSGYKESTAPYTIRLTFENPTTKEKYTISTSINLPVNS